MTKINVAIDCGNSPKMEFIKQFNIAFAKGDAEFIIDAVSESIHWAIYGDKIINGKEEFSKEINVMKDYLPEELTLHSIIAHGKSGAVNGEILMDGKTYAFCDVYTFKSAGSRIINSIHSYVINTKG